MNSENGEKDLKLDDEALRDLLQNTLGKGTGLPFRENCPTEMEIFEYVYGEIPEEISRIEIKEHMDTCEACRSCFLRLEAEKALDEWQVRKGTSLWRKYQARVQSALDGFQAARETVMEWLSDSITPLSLRPVYRGGPARSPSFRDSYTLGAAAPIFPLSIPPSAAGHVRYHTLISLRLQRNDIVVLYENRPIRWPFHISPEFKEEDLGVNQLYLILSAHPLEIDEDEGLIDSDRFMEIILEAESEGSLVAILEVEVLPKEGQHR
jgi:hypothetical protein